MSLQLINPNEIISIEQLANLYNELKESHSNLWNELLKVKYNSENGMVNQTTNEKNILLQCDRERALSLNRLQLTCQLSLSLFNVQRENEKLIKDKQQLEKQVSQLKQELEQKNKVILETKINLENAENLLKISECKHSDALKEINNLSNLKTTKPILVQSTTQNHNRIELMNLDESYLQEQRELELAIIRKNLSLISFTEFETQQKLESVLSGNNILRVLYTGQTFRDWKNFLKQKTSHNKHNNESSHLNEYLTLVQQNAKILIDCLVMYKLEFSTLSISGTQYVYIDYYSSENYEQDLHKCCDRFLEFLTRTLKTEPTPEFTKIVYKAIRTAGQYDDVKPKPKTLDKHVTWSVTLEPTKDKQQYPDLPKTHPFVYRLLFLNSDRLVLSDNLMNLCKSK